MSTAKEKIMNQKNISQLSILNQLAKKYLKEKILFEWVKKDSDKTKLSFRDLEKITGLNSKQLQRIIHEDKFPHFESVLKACQGLLDNTKNLPSKKSRE